MAYNSIHPGPAIDAAVSRLNEIGEIRDESNANLAAVEQTAQQVSTNAQQAVSAKNGAEEALNTVIALTQAYSDVSQIVDEVGEARDEAVAANEVVQEIAGQFGDVGSAVATTQQKAAEATGAASSATTAANTAVQARDAALLTAGSFGVFATKALLNDPANLVANPGQSAQVLEGTDAGWYYKVGGSGTGSWERLPNQPASTAALAGLGITQDGQPTTVETGPDYGRIVASLRDDGDRAPLMVNDEGEVAIPKLLGGEVIARPDRGEQSNYDYSIVDGAGNPKLGVKESRLIMAPDELVADMSALDSHNYPFAVVDEENNVAAGVLGNEFLLGLQPSTKPSIALEMEAAASAVPVGEQTNADFAVIGRDYNHVIMESQSLGNGQEAFPALSTAQRYGNLMLGNSVRPVAASGETFAPVGGAAWKPLAATVRDASTGALLTPQQVALQPAGNQSMGETPLEAMCNGLKRGLNDRFQMLNDPRALVASAVGVSGMTIEALSKGASPHLYGRYLTCLSAAKALADAESKSYGVAVVALMQGEANYAGDAGGTKNEEAYKTLFLQWVSDLASDAKAITGQDREPLFLTYQTGGAYTRDTENLSIGMAQWRATRERDNLYMAAPVYPVTDKGGHLDANGSRWIGWQFAKVAIWSSVYRRRWRPLEPVQIRQDGTDIYVAYHVPNPPLRFADIYVVNTPTMFADKGFRVQDETGYLAVTGVEIVSPHVIKITLSEKPTGQAFVWYADKTLHNGGGNLADSDTTVADDMYEYLAGSGMYPSANIPALVNKRYPLANFSIAFRLPVGFTE